MNGGEPSGFASDGPRRLLRVAGLVDASGLTAPGAILLDGSTIVASGRPEAIGATGGDVQVENRPDDLLLPALVNAHAHLDLTHIGPRPAVTSFRAFVDLVRRERAMEPAAVIASVCRGVELARAGGTGLIGDIAGAPSDVAAQALRDAGLPGVSYSEHFGIGRGRDAAADRLADASLDVEPWNGPQTRLHVQSGVQPHAPYSCAAETYRAAAALRLPLATHLAETLDEERFVCDAEGPLMDFLNDLTLLDDSIRPQQCSPVTWWTEMFVGVDTAPKLVAHVNYPRPGDLDRLAQCAAVVAYCPRASAFFGHPQDDRASHEWRAMLHAGVPVALGTDSIIGLDRADRISVLDEMRWLARHDGASLAELLPMATIHGALGLGFDPGLVTLAPGRSAGIIALTAGREARIAEQILLTDEAPRWVMWPGMDFAG